MKDFAKQFEPLDDDRRLDLADRGLAEFEQRLSRITPLSTPTNVAEILAASGGMSPVVTPGQVQRSWFAVVAGSWCGGALVGAALMFVLLRAGVSAEKQTAVEAQASEVIETTDSNAPVVDLSQVAAQVKPEVASTSPLSEEFNWDPLEDGVQLTVLTSRRLQRTCCYDSPGFEGATEFGESGRSSDPPSDAEAAAPPSTRQTMMNELLN